MAEYAAVIGGQTYKPREYLEHQLNMGEEEKEQRQSFFTELFEKHNASVN